MKPASELIPWKVTDIPVRPYPEMWSFNNSIHFDGKLWRMVLRSSDYAMPGGVTIRSSKGHASATHTKNAMVILDPDTWQVAKLYKMAENDGQTRVSCANYGYEDMRIFTTDTGGFQGIAASLHLNRGKMDVGRGEGATNYQPPEQVIISFDGEYNIVHVKPIRGSSWSGRAQKNWAPFDHAVSPRFLYAIDRGVMFDENGSIEGEALVTPSPSRSLIPIQTVESAERREQREREEREAREREEHEAREREERARREHEEREREHKERERKEREKASRRPVSFGRMPARGAEVKGVRGRTIITDTLTQRPSTSRRTTQRVDNGGSNTKHVSTGRALPPRYAGIRGGSQLIHIGDDRWLGVGHSMDFRQNKKFYWHQFFLTDKHGKVISVSDSCKLAPEGIEFAAGMAIDGDRVVVSFGVDDMNCRLGETSLSSVLGILHPAES